MIRIGTTGGGEITPGGKTGRRLNRRIVRNRENTLPAGVRWNDMQE